MMVLTEKPEVDQIDAALLVEELIEIYITPTPKGWREPEKVNTVLIDLCLSITIAGGLYLYPWLIRVLNEHD